MTECCDCREPRLRPPGVLPSTSPQNPTAFNWRNLHLQLVSICISPGSIHHSYPQLATQMAVQIKFLTTDAVHVRAQQQRARERVSRWSEV